MNAPQEQADRKSVKCWTFRSGGSETWRYARAADARGVALRACVRSSGVGGALRYETTVSYPADYAVPKELRGRTVSHTGFDGVTETSAIETETWDEGTRTFALDAGGAFLRTTTRRARGSAEADTYEVSVEDALRRLTVSRTTRLTDGGAVVASEHSAYDDIGRLRSTVYLDGTSLTNAYSCCRLLWRRDREGRKTLRSAQTGTDHLYNATEDVWLADVSTNGQHRVIRIREVDEGARPREPHSMVAKRLPASPFRLDRQPRKN